MEINNVHRYKLEMMPYERSYVLRAAVGLVCALLISSAVVGISEYVWARSENLNGLPVWRLSSLAQGIVVGIPYGILALIGVSAMRAWASACCTTTMLWGYYLQTTVSGQADHGIGIAMFFSPAPVLGVAFLSLLTLVDGRKADEITASNNF